MSSKISCSPSLSTAGYMTISYLVSTAGHAQEQNDAHPHDVKTILQLIHDGAKELGDEKVVGFPDLEAGKWVCKRYSQSARPYSTDM